MRPKGLIVSTKADATGNINRFSRGRGTSRVSISFFSARTWVCGCSGFTHSEHSVANQFGWSASDNTKGYFFTCINCVLDKCTNSARSYAQVNKDAGFCFCLLVFIYRNRRCSHDLWRTRRSRCNRPYRIESLSV